MQAALFSLKPDFIYVGKTVQPDLIDVGSMKEVSHTGETRGKNL